MIVRMKTVNVIIANKCRMGFTAGAIKFSTRSGKRSFFNLPHSQITIKGATEIKINDVHSEPAVEYEISSWIFKKIEDQLKSMKDFDCIILTDKE